MKSNYNPYRDGKSYLSKYASETIKEYKASASSLNTDAPIYGTVSYFLRDLNQSVKTDNKELMDELDSYVLLWKDKKEEIIIEHLINGYLESEEEYLEFFDNDIPSINYETFILLLNNIIRDLVTNKYKGIEHYKGELWNLKNF